MYTREVYSSFKSPHTIIGLSIEAQKASSRIQFRGVGKCKCELEVKEASWRDVGRCSLTPSLYHQGWLWVIYSDPAAGRLTVSTSQRRDPVQHPAVVGNTQP